MSIQPIYYSPADFPIAETMWKTATETPGNGWQNTLWKVTKFVLLFLPALAATILDLTIFNLARCTVGNLVLLIKNKFFTPVDESWTSHLKQHWKEYAATATFVATCGLSLVYGYKLWNYADKFLAEKIATKEMAAKTPPLGLVDIVSEHIGEKSSSFFSWVDDKIAQWPSYLLSQVQSKVQWGLTPFVALDATTGGWLSYLFPKGPLFAIVGALPMYMEPALNQANAAAGAPQTRLLPDFYYRGYRQVFSSTLGKLWMYLASANFFFGPFLHARDVSTGIADFSKAQVKGFLFLAYPLLGFAGLGLGSFWVADRVERLAQRVLRFF